MGTRINVLFAHGLADWRDRAESLSRLEIALPSAMAVRDYWNDIEGTNDDRLSRWSAEPPFPPPHTRDYLRYTGPGSLFVSINPSVGALRTGGRWRGFLSIQPLRDVHLAAFRSCAAAFEATEFWCFADNDFVNDVFWEGGQISECLGVLTKELGRPQPLIREIDPQLAAETEHTTPRVWTTWYRGTI